MAKEDFTTLRISHKNVDLVKAAIIGTKFTLRSFYEFAAEITLAKFTGAYDGRVVFPSDLIKSVSDTPKTTSEE